MGDYIVTSKGLVSTDELMHYARGSEGKNHKYYKREWKNGRWQYYYSKDQYTSDKVNQMIGAGDSEKEYRNDAQEFNYEANQLRKAGHSKRSDQVYAFSKDGRFWTKGARNHKERNERLHGALMAKKEADEHTRKAEKAGKEREHAARDIARVETSSKSYKAGLKVRAKKAKAAYYKNKATSWLKSATKKTTKTIKSYTSKGKKKLSSFFEPNLKPNQIYLKDSNVIVEFGDVELK